jgi:putative transposase
VPRICAGLDGENRFPCDCPLANTVFPYVGLDASYCKARVSRRWPWPVTDGGWLASR